MRLKDKNVLITGCNRGLGKAIVEKMLLEGANVWAHARKESTEYEAFLKEMSDKYGGIVEPIYFELTDSLAIKNEIHKIMQSKRPVDVLVNNAGIAHGGLFQATPMSTIRDIFDVNFFAAMELTQLVARLMIRRKSGSIINIASISGLNLSAGNCAYGVSKASLIAATKTLAAEYTPLGIRINAVAPGLLDTDMAELMEDRAYDEMVGRSFMKRLGKPSEVANVVSFLASEEASFISGQTIRVDGGSI
ncbi:MAG: hypothetical protein H6Q59_1034 [Firmicutes bacterium]|nr:hypothetical protein [Bacillota bacterium]